MLARVDCRRQPRLAQMFRVQTRARWSSRSWAGSRWTPQPGILPPSDLRKWLDAVLKAGGMEVETPQDPRLEAADEALIMGDLDEAEQAYKKILSDSPRDAAAEAGLAHVVVAKRAKGVDPVAALAEADAKPDDLRGAAACRGRRVLVRAGGTGLSAAGQSGAPRLR